MRPITDRDFETLNELAPSNLDDEREWHTPLGIGGSNGSHHSNTLRKLAKRGLVEMRQRSTGIRGSKEYRISDGGWTLVLQRAPRRTRAENKVRMDEINDRIRARKASRAAATNRLLCPPSGERI